MSHIVVIARPVGCEGEYALAVSGKDTLLSSDWGQLFRTRKERTFGEQPEELAEAHIPAAGSTFGRFLRENYTKGAFSGSGRLGANQSGIWNICLLD